MNPFTNIFPKPHTLLIVIHVKDVEQTLRNVRTVCEAGADGVFLIDHSDLHGRLDGCYLFARKAFPDLWIGLNYLSLDNRTAIRKIEKDPSVSGLWVDDGGIRERAEDPVRQARDTHDWKKHLLPEYFPLFGGVAFKGQETVYDVARVAQLATPYIDVITTSGSKTGTPPDVEKSV